MWVTFASGYQVVYQALVVILTGVVLYAFLNARRQRVGEVSEPTDLPPQEPAVAPAHDDGTGRTNAGGRDLNPGGANQEVA